MRNRPDSVRHRGVQDHRPAVVPLNNAATAVTISGLGNPQPQCVVALLARSQARRKPVRLGTFSAHITSPPTLAGLMSVTRSTSGRTLATLPPCGLAASGARDLPSARLPAAHRGVVVVLADDLGPGVEEVGPVTDDAMRSIRAPAPGTPGTGHREAASRKLLVGKCKHRVRFMSVRRTD